MDKFDYMSLAIKEAKKSLKTNDIPIGAVIVQDGKVIAKAHNLREKTKQTISHAEILAISKANRKVRDFRLEDMEIYVTKEPCLMCMGALLSARIKKIYFGASDKRFGTKDLAENNNFNHKCEIEGGILEEECATLLSEFFKKLR